MDKAVNAVFAALIWHSQEIREEVIPFGKYTTVTCSVESVVRHGHLSTATLPALPTATTGLLHAFTVAEAMRRDLVEARQKLVEAKEKEEDEDKKAKIDEDAPGTDSGLLPCDRMNLHLIPQSRPATIRLFCY